MKEPIIKFVNTPIDCLEQGLANIIKEKEKFIKDCENNKLGKDYPIELVAEKVNFYNDTIKEYIKAINRISKK